MIIYTYSKDVYPSRLDNEIHNSTLDNLFLGLNTAGSVVYITMSEELTDDSLIILNAIVENHILSIPSDIFQKTVIERRSFAEDLIERFKIKNITDSINLYQAFWMHHRMRALEITYNGKTFTIDMMNLVVSGDIEVACVALQLTAPDDMTETFHWLSSARIAWLVSEMKTYLGWP